MRRACIHGGQSRSARWRALPAVFLSLAALPILPGPAPAQQPAKGSSSVQAPASGQEPAARMETVTVALDHARVVKLPERTSTVIVGNPIIADVAVQKNGILVVTGKSYGQTNLIALDSGGQMLAESLIAVRQSLETIMTVQRGLDRESYSCTPYCQPAIQLGDAPKHFGEISGQAGARNSQATGAK